MTNEFMVSCGETPFDYTVGQVVAVDGDTVVWTPVYSKLHKQVYATTTLDRVAAGAAALAEVAAEEEAEARAEQWAETAWLRHAEYDPRYEDPREW